MAKIVTIRPNALEFSSTLLMIPVCLEEIIACIVSGKDVCVAFIASIGEAILTSRWRCSYMLV